MNFLGILPSPAVSFSLASSSDLCSCGDRIFSAHYNLNRPLFSTWSVADQNIVIQCVTSSQRHLMFGVWVCIVVGPFSLGLLVTKDSIYVQTLTGIKGSPMLPLLSHRSLPLPLPCMCILWAFFYYTCIRSAHSL